MTWNEGVLREKAKRKGMFVIYHLPCEKQENNQQEGGARTRGLVLQRTGWADQEFRAEWRRSEFVFLYSCDSETYVLHI